MSIKCASDQRPPSCKPEGGDEEHAPVESEEVEPLHPRGGPRVFGELATDFSAVAACLVELCRVAGVPDAVLFVCLASGILAIPGAVEFYWSSSFFNFSKNQLQI